MAFIKKNDKIRFQTKIIFPGHWREKTVFSHQFVDILNPFIDVQHNCKKKYNQSNLDKINSNEQITLE